MTGGSLGSRASDRGKSWEQAVRKAAAVPGWMAAAGLALCLRRRLQVSLSEHWQPEVLTSGSRPHRRRQAGP